MKKLMCLLLAVLFAVTALVACSGSNNKKPVDSTSTSGDKTDTGDVTGGDTTGGDEPVLTWQERFKDYKYNNVDFVILAREARKDQFASDDAATDAFSQSVYNRTAKMEEFFGIYYAPMYLADDESIWNNAILADVGSNDGSYDVVMPDYYWTTASYGSYMDLSQYDELDFSRPYWFAGWNDSTLINGKQTTAVGSFSLDTIALTHAVFVNMDLLGNTGTSLEQLYDMVNSKTWTSDKMIELARKVTVDVDSDGVINPDAGDIAGMVFGDRGLYGTRSIPQSFGFKTSVKDEDGKWTLFTLDEATLEIYNQAKKHLFNETAANSGEGPLREGRNLFYTYCLEYTISQLTNMEGEYAIVPSPLMNEKQENYISYNHGTYYFAIIQSAKDVKMSAAVLEALNAESYESVRPAYYEIMMKNRWSRVDGVGEMLDIIVDSVFFDFAFVNYPSLYEAIGALSTPLRNESESPAAHYNSVHDAIVLQYKLLFDNLDLKS